MKQPTHKSFKKAALNIASVKKEYDALEEEFVNRGAYSCTQDEGQIASSRVRLSFVDSLGV